MSGKSRDKHKSINDGKKIGDKDTGLFRLKKMIKKEFRLLGTDKMNLLIALVIPPAVIFLFAFMINQAGETPPIPCVVISSDSNSFVNPNSYVETTWDNYTFAYLDAVDNHTESLDLLAFYNTSEEVYAMEIAREQLLSGEISIIIVLNVEFSEMIIGGMPAFIESVPDSSDIMNIQTNLNAVADSIAAFTDLNNLTPQFVYNTYEEFSIPSEYSFQYNYNITLTLSFIIFGISMVLTILVVVQEKPIPRLLLSPAKREEILLSKYITYMMILAFQVTTIMVVCLMTGLYCRGSLIQLWIALYTVGMTGLSLGIFVSTLSNTKTEANQLFFALFIVIVLLSGIFIPVDAMPLPLQIFAYILPLSHGDPMIRGIVTKGKGFFGFDFLCLMALVAALILITFLIMKRKRYEV
ncbi:MAG: ABC transporter permease subunit [Candidatus Lokiarchaeota archaeon]|nr:ABC transporter permease subunit [Candidatus Lokiarchaeota archaeon]